MLLLLEVVLLLVLPGVEDDQAPGQGQHLRLLREGVPLRGVDERRV